MKKITMLVSASKKDSFLIKLRQAGVVHIKGISVPSSNEITEHEDTITLIKSAVDILSMYKGAAAKEVKNIKGQELIKIANQLVDKSGEREAAVRNVQNIKSEIEWFKPWGGFDTKDLEALREEGVFIKLYRIRKKDLEKIKDEHREKIRIITKRQGYLYIVFITCRPGEGLDFDEVKSPSKGCDELKKDLAHFTKCIETIDAFFARSLASRKLFKDEVPNLEKRLDFLNVSCGMGSEESFSYLQGFCPQEELGRVTTLAKKEDAGYLIEDPDDPYETPTLIKNPRWVNTISPVFKFMNTLPGYREYDISLPFLVFFSLFFAMLIGDAGYGLLFLVMTYLAKRHAKNAPSEPFNLLYILSFATFTWGAVTGTWFGIERVGQLPVFNAVVIDKINSFTVNNQNFMIYLCFIIGAVHLTVAHLIQAVRIINSFPALAQAGWILVIWGLFFTAGTLVIGKPFPAFAAYLLSVGAGLILLFSNFQRNFIKGVLITLVDLPLKIISSFSDVVSYLRLFAVGYASVIMAKSFNDMALSAGFGSIISSLGAAFILIFGHSLNIVLGLMAVVVHGIRLNMLEFSGHLGMEWSGREYRPFKE